MDHATEQVRMPQGRDRGEEAAGAGTHPSPGETTAPPATPFASGQVRILNQLFKVHGDQSDVYFRSHIERGEYDEPLVNTFAALVEDDAVCLDIGANLGLTSLLLGSLARKGHIHAFEPNPRTFEMLRQNIAANRCANVSCHNLALGDVPGQLSFVSTEGMLAGSFVVREEPASKADKRFPSLSRVEAISVDAFVAGEKLDRLDFLKIDVEGFELEVLAGCAEALRRFRPTVLVEFNSGTLVRFADVSPRTALERIHALFPETYLVDRDTGLLRRLVTERDRDKLIYHNLASGLVDNLVCTYPENKVLARVEDFSPLARELDSARAHLHSAQAQLDSARAQLDSARAQLAALQSSRSWRMTGPLRRVARLWRNMNGQTA
jgi:FkbM family methyltransferase